MIQRVQSLLLAGVVICMAATFALPLWEKYAPGGDERVILNVWHADRMHTEGIDGDLVVSSRRTHPWLALLCASSVIVAAYSIFRYDNRMLQIKLGLLNSFLIMAALASAAFAIFNTEEALQWTSKGMFRLGYFLPVAALILNSLANRFVKKDEDLVRSVDRIR